MDSDSFYTSKVKHQTLLCYTVAIQATFSNLQQKNSDCQRTQVNVFQAWLLQTRVTYQKLGWYCLSLFTEQDFCNEGLILKDFILEHY